MLRMSCAFIFSAISLGTRRVEVGSLNGGVVPRYAHAVKVALRGDVVTYGLMRETAYAEGATELVGPGDDPDGWELTTGSAKGKLFDQQDVEVFIRVSFIAFLSDGLSQIGVSTNCGYKKRLTLIVVVPCSTIDLPS